VVKNHEQMIKLLNSKKYSKFFFQMLNSGTKNIVREGERELAKKLVVLVWFGFWFKKFLLKF
jgi:hypothetical protein